MADGLCSHKKYPIIGGSESLSWLSLTPSKLSFHFQDVQKDYESRGWAKHHEQVLEFEETEGGSPPAISLHIAEPSTEDDKWEILPVTSHSVRKLSARFHSQLGHFLFHVCMLPTDFKAGSGQHARTV